MAGVERSTITGAKELDRVLKRFPSQITEKLLLSSLRAGATVFRKEARLRAPVRRIGSLKRLSTKSRKGRAPGFLRASVIIAKDRTTGASVGLKVGPARRAFYGMFQEFGTRHHPARPWLRPAYDAAKRRARDTTGKRLWRNIEKAAVKLAGSFAKSGLKSRRRR